MTICDQFAVFFFQLTLETTMGRVVFQHIDHVIHINERVIDCNDIHIAPFQCCTEKQTTDSTKTINTNFSHKKFLLKM